MKLTLITIFAFYFKFGSGNQQLSNTIRPNTDEVIQQKAALDVIRRVINEKANDVTIKINFNLPGNYFKVRRSLNSFYTRYGG
jgi:hypothetical protein